MKKSLAMILSFVMVFALLLTACGGGNKDNNSQGNGDAGASNTGSGSEENNGNSEDIRTEGSGTAATVTSARRDVLNVGLLMDVGDFNPWSFTGQGANNAIWGLYQPMLHFVDGQYYPSTVKEWSMSDDGLTFSGEIFDYIHDWAGNHYTASDVKFSLEAAMEVWPELTDIVASVEATGDYTFEVHFTRELYVGELDTITRTNVVSEAAYNDSPDEMHTTPVGSGPYKMVDYTSGYLISYETVDDFWQTDASQIHVRDMANADKVNFYILTESAQRSIGLEQRTIDFCSSVSANDLDKFASMDGYKLMSYPNNQSITLFPNCSENSVCQDVNLRLAICYAISNQAILDSVYNGRGQLNHDIAPSWDVGYNPDWDTEDNYYNYDPAKAAEYLAQSNYNNETLVIMCTADETSTNMAQLIVAFLEQVGIKATIDSYESTVYNQYSQDPAKWDILLKLTTANIFVAQANYSQLSSTRYVSGGGVSFIYDDHLQELLNACMSETNSTQDDRDALHEYIVENCYLMGLVNPGSYAVVPDTVTTLTLSYRNLPIAGASIFAE